MGVKVVVTGGAGFIGSHLVRMLAISGQEVFAVDRVWTPERRERVAAYAHIIDDDVLETDSMTDVFKGAFCVFHEAALPRVGYSIRQPFRTYEANVTGTLAVLEAARAAGVRRVVYAASSSAYGNQQSLELSEQLLPNPVSPYGAQKFMGEVLCRAWSQTYGLETVCLRYFNVYGPGFDPTGPYALVIGKFLTQRKAGQPLTITGDGAQTRDFTHVRDVVNANLLALTTGHVKALTGAPINIGAGCNISINALAALVGGPVVHIPARQEPHDTLADTARAHHWLGWQSQVTIEQGVAELKSLMGIE